jgi:hypothetical protein
MDSYVTFAAPGRRVRLHHGDLIGRLPSAALVVNDPRVSEAHAMVSRRRGAMCLLALRRQVLVDGVQVGQATLAPGQVVTLAPGLDLRVEEVGAPSHGLALNAPGLGQRLLAPVSSVLVGPPPTVVARFVPGAAAVVWSAGEQWRLRVDGGAARTIEPGDQVEVAGLTLTFTLAPHQAAGATTATGGPADPLRLTRVGDKVELQQGERHLVVSGLGARLLLELISLGGPVAWAPLARELWADGAGPVELRRRLDAVIQRLRATLRRAGIRADLVGADGAGQVQLVLYRDDVVVGGGADDRR